MAGHLARLGSELRWGVISDFCHQARRGSVLHDNGHLFGLAQREWLRRCAPHGVTGASRQQGKIARRDDRQAGVVDDGHKAQHG